MKYIEDEKKKLFILAKELESRAARLGRTLSPLVLTPEKTQHFSSEIVTNQEIIRKNSKILNFNDENGNETVFESFIGDELAFFQNNPRKKNSFLNNNLNNILANIGNSSEESSDKVAMLACVQEFQTYYPLKYVDISPYKHIFFIYLEISPRKLRLETNSFLVKSRKTLSIAIFKGSQPEVEHMESAKRYDRKRFIAFRSSRFLQTLTFSNKTNDF